MMDENTKQKVYQIYNEYLKDDPNFQRFYQNISSNYNQQSGDPSKIRRGSHDEKKVLESSDVTLEAEQTESQEIEQEKKVEKKRTLYDVVMAPKNQEEHIISTAALSGLVNQSDEKDLKSHEASTINMKGFVDVLNQRAQIVHGMKVLEREKREQAKEAIEAKESQQEKKETHGVMPSFEYGVMEEIQKSLRDAMIKDADTVDGPQAPPKKARDQAQQQKDFSNLPGRN